MNPSLRLESHVPTGEKQVDKHVLEKYLKLRKINGISDRWLYDVKAALTRYLEYLNWTVDEDKTLDFIKQMQERMTVVSYRKRVYQIRMFLTYLDIDWASRLKPPPEPHRIPKRVTIEDIHDMLRYFEGHQFEKQIKAIILLGASSGLRAEELYQLRPENIDTNNRIVYVNHEPLNGQHTKTAMSRISFFTEEAQRALSDYLTYFDDGRELKSLFGQKHLERQFRKAPIKVKDLRKFFSQEWDRRGGPTSIKKILMGHTLKNDVDLMHYNCQSEEDLKRVYDQVMSDVEMKSV